MINFPNIKKADVMHIDTNGLHWIYEEEKEVLLISKDGIETFPFSAFSPESLKEILKSIPESEDSTFTFSEGDKKVKLSDLIKGE